MITELTRKREEEKLRQAETFQEMAEAILYPHEVAFRATFEKIQSKDTQDLFKNPVNKQLVPDYFDIIKNRKKIFGICAFM